MPHVFCSDKHMEKQTVKHLAGQTDRQTNVQGTGWMMTHACMHACIRTHAHTHTTQLPCRPQLKVKLLIRKGIFLVTEDHSQTLRSVFILSKKSNYACVCHLTF